MIVIFVFGLNLSNSRGIGLIRITQCVILNFECLNVDLLIFKVKLFETFIWERKKESFKKVSLKIVELSFNSKWSLFHMQVIGSDWLKSNQVNIFFLRKVIIYARAMKFIKVVTDLNSDWWTEKVLLELDIKVCLTD